MITSRTPSSWQDLQEQSARILAECGFAVEIEKKVKLVRGQAEKLDSLMGFSEPFVPPSFPHWPEADQNEYLQLKDGIEPSVEQLKQCRSEVIAHRKLPELMSQQAAVV